MVQLLKHSYGERLWLKSTLRCEKTHGFVPTKCTFTIDAYISDNLSKAFLHILCKVTLCGYFFHNLGQFESNFKLRTNLLNGKSNWQCCQELFSNTENPGATSLGPHPLDYCNSKMLFGIDPFELLNFYAQLLMILNLFQFQFSNSLQMEIWLYFTSDPYKRGFSFFQNLTRESLLYRKNHIIICVQPCLYLHYDKHYQISNLKS